MYDAIVVGAGPAGSASAALLSRQGFRVLLVDRAQFPRDKACGEYTSPQTEQVLTRLGALEAVEKAGARRLHSMRVISPSGWSFTMDYRDEEQRAVDARQHKVDGDCDVSAEDTALVTPHSTFCTPHSALRTPQVLATPRRILDATLVDHARQCGAEVREQVKVEAVTMRDGRAGGVVLRERGGAVREEAARLVIGADGVHSAVVRSLGLAAPLRWPQNLGMVAHYRGHNGLDGWGEMHVSARGYAGLAPQSGGLLNVGLVTPMGSVSVAEATEGKGMSAVERFESFALSFPGVARCLQGAERVTGVRGVGPIGARVRRTYGPGYLLVGDAAGFFDPFTGEGVYKALRGAELAAQVAATALEKDDLSERSLSKYALLRRREFGAKELVCRLVQTFVGVPLAMDYVVSRLAKREGPRQVLTGVLGDLADPRAALTPRYLWSLLKP